MSPWDHCTRRGPPDYGLAPNDHAALCGMNTPARIPCLNPKTGRNDLELGVVTGDMAPDFFLNRTSDPPSGIKLSEMLTKKDAVLLKFGAYT